MTGTVETHDAPTRRDYLTYGGAVLGTGLLAGCTGDSPAETTTGEQLTTGQRDTVLAFMQEHSVARELTAVQNEQVYRGGYLFQGPIHNLFLTERGAQQLYPDVFGEEDGDEQLFDRQRVAEIIAGAF